MSEKILKGRLVQKHDTAENWSKATSFVPKQGEVIVYDIDENYTYERIKIGDGTTLVNALPFIGDEVLQSDWAQNNESAKDFIKNKTHYITEDVISEFYNNGELIGSVPNIGYMDANENFYFHDDTYLAIETLDGKIYENECSKLTGYPYNLYNVNDSSDSIMIGVYPGTTGYRIMLYISSYKPIRVKYFKKAIVQLDEMYIPDTIARTSSLQSNLEEAKAYTDSEIDTWVGGKTVGVQISEAIESLESGTVANATHATKADSATRADSAVTADSATNAENANRATTADTATNAGHATTAGHATSADTATTADSATKATQDASGNVITTTYETKTDSASKLTEAKGYTDSEIDKWVGDKTVATQIEEAMKEVPQSDWSQNDETAKDYIKNRPFYEDGSFVEVLPETTIAMEYNPDEGMSAGGFEGKLELEDGVEYSIMWNGTEFRCTAVEIEDGGVTATVIGAVGLITGTGCTECPFIILPLQVDEGVWATQVIGFGEYTQITVSISKGGFIKKLDNKFLDLEWLPTTIEKEILPLTEYTEQVNEIPIEFDELIKYKEAIIYCDGGRYTWPIVHEHRELDTDCGIYLMTAPSLEATKCVIQVPCNNFSNRVIFNTGGTHTLSISVPVANTIPEKFLPVQNLVTTTYVDNKVADLVDSAPGTLDTLNELAAALGDDPNFATTVATQIGQKANSSDLTSHTSNKSNPHGVTLSQLGVTATAAELNIMDGVTATTAELNYVDGVTSNIQTQLNAKVPTSRTVNGKALTGNITLSASDVGADASGSASSALTSAKSYTDAEITEWVGDKTVASQISTAISTKANTSDLTSHTGNNTVHITAAERTNWNKAQANVIESIKVNGTAQSITSKSVNITVPTDNKDLANGAGYLVASDIANKANKATTLAGYGITDAAAKSHTHDDRYYTKSEIDAFEFITVADIDSICGV